MAQDRTGSDDIYECYEPYPSTRRSRVRDYDRENAEDLIADLPSRDSPTHMRTLDELLGDHGPTDLCLPTPPQPNGDRAFRALPIIGSLFADRLDMLRATLDELTEADRERRDLTTEALEDIDYQIGECERILSIYRSNRALNDFRRRRHFERMLMDLKRQRHQETVLNWRDILALRREIRNIQREMASLGRVTPAAANTKPESGGNAKG
jgi:hypothetical protein